MSKRNKPNTSFFLQPDTLFNGAPTLGIIIPRNEYKTKKKTEGDSFY